MFFISINNKGAYVTTFICVMLMSALSGCKWFGEEATPHPKNPEVVVEIISPKPVDIITEVAGRTLAYQIAEVRPQVSGIIKARNFVEGSNVKAGETLYQIDPDTYKATYDSACAEYKRAKANLDPARFRAEKYAKLLKSKAVSQQEVKDMNAAYKQAKAAVDVAAAAMKTAKIRLDYTKVYAPITGRVGRSNVTPGALVTEGQSVAMTTIQQLDPMYVDITQSSVDLLKLRRAIKNGKLSSDGTHTAVTLRLEDGTDYSLDGKLQFTDVTVDRSTGMVTIRAIFPNPDMILLPNMYVRAFVNIGSNQNGILVNQRAVMRDSKGNAFVYCVNSENKIEMTPVVVSYVINNCWLVDSGLKSGDRVVVEGIQRIRPGLSVKIADAKNTTSSPSSQNTAK